MKIETDNWLAGILGCNAYRVGLPQGGPVSVPEKLAPGFYFAKVSTRQVEGVRALSAAGFYVVDVNTTFERTPDASLPVDVLVRDFQPEDTDAILEIAGSCFVYSRFHLDPLVPDEIAHRIKREWIANYARGARGDRLMVAELDGKPAGFLAVLAAKVGERPARVIDLVGVGKEFQGRGAGRALTQAFIRDYAGKCDILRVGTQAANIPSMRLYENCGFRMAETAYVLHAHIPEG